MWARALPRVAATASSRSNVARQAQRAAPRATVVAPRVAAAARVPTWTPCTSPAGGARCFIVRTLQDVRDAGNVQVAATGTWESRRFVLRKDGMG